MASSIISFRVLGTYPVYHIYVLLQDFFPTSCALPHLRNRQVGKAKPQLDNCQWHCENDGGLCRLIQYLWLSLPYFRPAWILELAWMAQEIAYIRDISMQKNGFNGARGCIISEISKCIDLRDMEHYAMKLYTRLMSNHFRRRSAECYD